MVTCYLACLLSSSQSVVIAMAFALTFTLTLSLIPSLAHSLTPSHTHSLLSHFSSLLSPHLSSLLLARLLSPLPLAPSRPSRFFLSEGFFMLSPGCSPVPSVRLFPCHAASLRSLRSGGLIGRLGISIAGLAAIRGCICCAQRSSWAAACSCEPRRICLLLPWLWPR